MVTKSLTVRRGGALARPKAKSLALAGADKLQQVLDHEIMYLLVDAQRFARSPDVDSFSREIHERFVERAAPVHRELLPGFAHASEVYLRLSKIVDIDSTSAVTQADANAILNFLFATMGKRRDDEAKAKLRACVDVFNPASNVIGESLGLWKPVSRDPVVLALAIKHLLAAKIFEPSENELRESLALVHRKLELRTMFVGDWIARVERADKVMFEFARPRWRAAYEHVGAAVVHAMTEWVERVDGAGSPRSQALDRVANERKQIAAE